MVLPVAVHTAREVTSTALLSRNHRVPTAAVLIQVVAAPALERACPWTCHPHVRITADGALGFTLLYCLHVSHDVVTHTIRSVALGISRAVLIAPNQTKRILFGAVCRDQIPVLMVAIFHHRHPMIVPRNHLHVTSTELIRSRTKLHRLAVGPWVDLPHEVIVRPSAVVACPDVIVAMA